MTKFQTLADAGSIRIFTGNLSCQFDAGSGDGRYAVVLASRGEFEQAGQLWKFVDSFEVAGAGVHLAAHDCENESIHEFAMGRYHVSNQRDERLVLIEKMS